MVTNEFLKDRLGSSPLCSDSAKERVTFREYKSGIWSINTEQSWSTAAIKMIYNLKLHLLSQCQTISPIAGSAVICGWRAWKMEQQGIALKIK